MSNGNKTPRTPGPDLVDALERAKQALERAEQQLDYGQVDAALRIIRDALRAAGHPAYQGD